MSATSGNLQTPKAGTVGSKDSLSGAPEAHKGEAVEQEARHFVAGLGSVAISTAVGKGPGEDGNGNAVGGGEAEAEGVDKPASAIDGAAPDPTALATDSVAAKNLASGDNAAKDPAKVPVEQAMWNKARPIMRALNNVADVWERLGKYVDFCIRGYTSNFRQCTFAYSSLSLPGTPAQARWTFASGCAGDLLHQHGSYPADNYVCDRRHLLWTTSSHTWLPPAY